MDKQGGGNGGVFLGVTAKQGIVSIGLGHQSQSSGTNFMQRTDMEHRLSIG